MRRLDRLRGRGRPVDDAADACQDLGPHRPEPGGAGARGLGQGVDGWHDLLRTGRAVPADLRGPRVQRTQGPTEGFGWQDFRDLLVRVRIQLGGPIVLVWDHVRIHLTAPLREFIAANAEWLTVFQLPAYAPDLNPQEGVWSLVKRDLGNLAVADLGQITRAVKRSLKTLQYRPQVIDGCLHGTGLVLDG
ncbi:transposase [Streptomyces flavidovirens]|uniref:Transposase n=1 Tax=Streptomyces flavidovirens TaxID=67298 RepID=A0ABW6RNH5_9ACTN